jgi:hypothetical protein
MCKCKESKGFAGAISNAKRLTDKTNTPYGVYIVNEVAYLSLVSGILSRTDICCYYNHLGEQIDIPKVVEKKITKKKEVVEEKPIEEN